MNLMELSTVPAIHTKPEHIPGRLEDPNERARYMDYVSAAKEKPVRKVLDFKIFRDYLYIELYDNELVIRMPALNVYKAQYPPTHKYAPSSPYNRGHTNIPNPWATIWRSCDNIRLDTIPDSVIERMYTAVRDVIQDYVITTQQTHATPTHGEYSSITANTWTGGEVNKGQKRTSSYAASKIAKICYKHVKDICIRNIGITDEELHRIRKLSTKIRTHSGQQKAKPPSQTLRWHANTPTMTNILFLHKQLGPHNTLLDDLGKYNPMVGAYVIRRTSTKIRAHLEHPQEIPPSTIAVATYTEVLRNIPTVYKKCKYSLPALLTASDYDTTHRKTRGYGNVPHSCYSYSETITEWPTTRIEWFAITACLQIAITEARRVARATREHLNTELNIPAPRHAVNHSKLLAATKGITKPLTKIELKDWHFYRDNIMDADTRYRFNYSTNKEYKRKGKRRKMPYSCHKLKMLYQYILDAKQIYDQYSNNSWSVKLSKVNLTSSIGKNLRSARFNHNQDKKIRVRIALEKADGKMPSPPSNFPKEMEKYRLLTKHEMYRAGIECDNCIGSYAEHNNDLFYRKGDVCAQVSRESLTVTQAYDKKDTITDTSRAFSNWIKSLLTHTTKAGHPARA